MGDFARVYNTIGEAMKIVLLVLFILNGCFFLLISTVLYPAITNTLVGIRDPAAEIASGFWDLPSLLGILRVIFICAGGFLIVFGIGMFLRRDRWMS
jgi:hypothetical protein